MKCSLQDLSFLEIANWRQKCSVTNYVQFKNSFWEWGSKTTYRFISNDIWQVRLAWSGECHANPRYIADNLENLKQYQHFKLAEQVRRKSLGAYIQNYNGWIAIIYQCCIAIFETEILKILVSFFVKIGKLWKLWILQHILLYLTRLRWLEIYWVELPE